MGRNRHSDIFKALQMPEKVESVCWNRRRGGREALQMLEKLKSVRRNYVKVEWMPENGEVI